MTVAKQEAADLAEAALIEDQISRDTRIAEITNKYRAFSRPEVIEMNEALKEQWKCELKALADKKSKIMENKSKLYWLIRGNMSAESVDRVKAYLGAKFDDLEESADPLLLWRAIRDTHTAYSTGSNYSDAARVKLAYNNIKQYPGESLSGYKDRIDVAVKAMIAVGLTPPSEQEMAADFSPRLMLVMR